MFGNGHIKEIGGDFVSVSVATLDEITPEQLAKLPIRYMDGRHDNWFELPKHTRYLFFFFSPPPPPPPPPPKKKKKKKLVPNRLGHDRIGSFSCWPMALF